TDETLRELEPHITLAAHGAVFYPQDCQVQPILAAAHLLRLAQEAGAKVFPHTRATGFTRAGERVTGVQTPSGTFSAGAVLNATGTWAGEVADLAGTRVPVLPRRGFVVV